MRKTGFLILAAVLLMGAAVKFTTDQMNYLAPGTGGVAELLTTRLSETAYVKGYGAPGAGILDETAAIQAAIDANKGKTVVLGAGTYLVTSLSLVGTTYNRTRIVGQNATITCNSAVSTTCINIDGTVGVELSGEMVIRPIGASYADAIKISGGNQNRILPGVRIGFYDEQPAPFTSDIAWGYYGGNAVNGVHLIGKTSGTNPLSFYNSIIGLQVKSIGGFAVVCERVGTGICNGNIVRGLSVRGANGVKILGGTGNQFDIDDLETSLAGIYLDTGGSTAATDNRINVTWSEYAQLPVFWGSATANSKGNVITYGHAGVHYARPYFAVPRPGGTANRLFVNNGGISSNKQEQQETSTGAATRLRTVWAEDDAFTYGPELFVDGSAEANSASWVTLGSATQTQSAEQAHGGTFSRKVVSSAAAGQNGVQQTIATTVGTVYRFAFWIYLVAPGFDNYNNMDAFAGSDLVGFWRSAEGTWTRVAMFTRATSTSTIFKWADLGDTAGLTWYVDDASVMAVTGGATGHLAEWGETFGQVPRTISGFVNLDGTISTPGITTTGTTGLVIGSTGTAITKSIRNTTTWNPGIVATNTAVTTTITTTGAVVGADCSAGVSDPAPLSGYPVQCIVTADTCNIAIRNQQNASFTFGSATFWCRVNNP